MKNMRFFHPLPERIGVRETNEMNPPMNRRNVGIVVETRGVSSLWDQFAGSLKTGGGDWN
ncbi:hypothetical protein GGD63_008180 [Bradyrhizobium sp. cir1]|nr:hypothetical protein [Bradyrhizobium sp. cir1]